MDWLNWLADEQTLNTIFFYISATIASMSALATVFDSDNSDPWVQKIMAGINILALNFGKARNADQSTDWKGDVIVEEAELVEFPEYDEHDGDYEAEPSH